MSLDDRFVQTQYIFPIVPTENGNSTAEMGIQLYLILYIVCMFWISL